MNTNLIRVAASDIEKNQKALSWFEEYGHNLLSRDRGSFKIAVTLYAASACVGATEATEMLSAYAASMIEDILMTAQKGCANTIEIRRDQIKQEIGE
ncbi:hypothetical protein FHT87_005220 [Rhizobium sp. BK316]|uniref:hypothetical protein n=1 Tax=Rhizobium sp. BK316 TaxID=2587053 RepID=UPI0016141241|nr:hypothetical protein [Rhizobium sp. BK316]MBB3411267.1 hypothetical protein [Rhizobium sp. BK316]